MSVVRCGRCRNYHESIAAVRECCNGGKPAVIDVKPMTGGDQRPSDKQVAFANKLLGQLGRSERTEAEWIAKGQTRRSISELINDLLIDVGMAKKAGTLAVPAQRQERSRHLQAVDYPAASAGYYAVPSITGNNDLDFFRVDVPAEGTWSGCLFVKRVIGGDRAERVRQSTAKEFLELISTPALADFSAAMYGKALGRCGRCNRTLTDETSRARGIGPDCAAKMGF